MGEMARGPAGIVYLLQRRGFGSVLTIGKLGASPDQLGCYEQQVA